MKILALDTSSNVASVALVCDSLLIGEYTINHKKTHSQSLMPLIRDMLNATQTDISDIDAFAASVGPGSFTGLRIGLATVKGLAHACKKPVAGVSTLEAMAYNLPYCSDYIVPILDARRDQVYTAVYCWDNGVLKTHTKPCAVSVDTIIEILKKENKKSIFIGDGILRFGEQIINMLGDLAAFSYANSNMQRASSVAVAAQKLFAEGKAVFCDKLAPIYLRKSQAEREYEEKHKSNA